MWISEVLTQSPIAPLQCPNLLSQYGLEWKHFEARQLSDVKEVGGMASCQAHRIVE